MKILFISFGSFAGIVIYELNVNNNYYLLTNIFIYDIIFTQQNDYKEKHMINKIMNFLFEVGLGGCLAFLIMSVWKTGNVILSICAIVCAICLMVGGAYHITK